LLFNSYAFLLVFLPIVVAGYFLLPGQRLRLVFLVAASYVFYAYEEWWFPALMLAVTATSFLGGLALAAVTARRGRKLVLAAGIACVLALLGAFKYAGFGSYYLSEFVATVTGTGLPGLEEAARGILLPAGISFYTFEAISYLVDVFRGTIPAERNPVRFGLFISFFPHLIAGPIVRYGQLKPQLERKVKFDGELFRVGVLLLALGLAKKVLLADGIAKEIDPVLGRTAELGAVDAWTAMVAYSFQIYLDFSAYTDMALGLALMLGIRLPWNFDRPYRAASPQEFWRRWHVTLSTWLRDYLYIPLGGNRKGTLRRDANLMVTMGLGGLWHGASLNFLAWGLWHGGLLAAHRRLASLPIRLPRPLAVALTFLLVTVGWVFFRFRDSADVRTVFEAMAGFHGAGSALTGVLPFLVVAAALMWGTPEERNWSLPRWRATRLALAGVALALAVAAMDDTAKFLYFEF
jgi:D-alanyl-lipoteichoic acid acyltransferase DltB (MBOAT superfamily)